jgi:hypothetical protein
MFGRWATLPKVLGLRQKTLRPLAEAKLRCLTLASSPTKARGPRDALLLCQSVYTGNDALCHPIYTGGIRCVNRLTQAVDALCVNPFTQRYTGS